MPADTTEQPRETLPTLSGALVFRAKSTVFQLRRHAQDLLSHHHARHPRGNSLAVKNIIAESKTTLWAQGDAAGERILQVGKVHNLRIAVRRLDGVEVPAGAIFSFWKHVGRVSRRKGYARGREVREGCLIPNIGGGLCQLSNALYDAALKADFEIVERHAHSRIVPGSLAEIGRDATVFWNYVDLRWRSARSFRIEAILSRVELIVRFRAADDDDVVVPLAQTPHDLNTPRPALKQRVEPQHATTRATLHTIRTSATAATMTNTPATLAPATTNTQASGDCFTCGVHECFRHAEKELEKLAASDASFGRAAFLVDEFWPEFDEYMRAERNADDLLCLPLDGQKLGKANYAWDTSGFGEVREQRLATAWRSLSARRLAAQGAARQRTLLRHAEKLADAYARTLAYDVTHVTVMQSLLPFLWLGGHLGGRSFDVLMNSLPLERLQENLDAAAALHPESSTLADFRADERLVNAEREVLAEARRIITPHAHIASLYGARAVRLDWQLPRVSVAPASKHSGTRVVFPASTVGRKGAYEVREAARRLGFTLVITGALQTEKENFWDGVSVERCTGEDWLDDACVVVLPAFVEHKPRRLLEALARGVHVIATEACGLGERDGVTTIAAGDMQALCAQIEKSMAGAH